MHFTACAVLTSVGLFFDVVHAAHSNSTASSACPPHYASEIEQRQNWEAFVQQYYVEQEITEPFDNYVWVDLIQHHPGIGQGRDAAITYLESVRTAGSTIQIVHTGFGNNTGWIHHYNNGATKFVDVFRFDGSCIVEHWDVIANLTTGEIDPVPLATPPPIPPPKSGGR
jgi:predicted SnoaL-like aldol condensation-catalyzing enzyme